MADQKKESRIVSEVFRFASVRSPQTMSTRDAEIRTIPFQNTEGAFFVRLLDARNNGVTHVETMANLKAECVTMKDGVNYFKLLDDLYGVTDVGAIKEFAETLIGNRRSNELSIVLAPAIVGLKTLSTNSKNILWNNLFVHMISGGNVYVRQEIINILITNNFLENYSGLRDDEQKILANANLILPATLFPLSTEVKISDEESTDDNTIEIDKDAAAIRIANRERIINEINRLIYLQGEMVRPVDTFLEDDREAVNLYVVFTEDFHNSMNQDIASLLSIEMQNIGFSYGIGTRSVINLLESANSYEYNQLFRNAKLGKEVAVIGSGVYQRGGPGDGRPPFSPFPPKDPPLENDPYTGIYPYGSYGRIKPLGVMDLRIVEQELCCYVPGEVAHIENIMQGEYKERATRRLRRTEETFSSTVETETLDETDTESTDRYEMQKETSKELAKDKSFELGLNVSTKIPYVNIDASTSYSNSTSSQESYFSAVNYAKEVTQRALKRVQEKIIKEQSLKVINEFEENNRHGLDNRFGGGHSVGIYRWIDKIYKATVKNYGKRLMFEFMIPDPASYYIWSKTRAGEADSPQLVEPIAPWSNAVSEFGLVPLTSHTQITRSNYDNWAAAYGAEVSVPKREEIIVSKAFAGNHDAQQIVAGVHDIEIPEGYETRWANIKVDIIPASGVEIGNFKVSIGDSQTFMFGPTSQQVDHQNWNIPIHNISGSVPVRYTAYHQGHNHNTLSIYIVCRFKIEAEEEWKMKTYRSIIDAYERRKAEYQSKLAEAKSVELYSIEGKNPGFNRKIEQRELKKGCMKWLFEQFSDQYNPQSNGFGHFGMSGYESTDPSQPPITAMTAHVLHEGRKAKYANDSFDWSLMSYSFLPYYWSGDKSRWVQTTALEDNDHIFQEFLQAGFAKVMVPVKLGREKSIMHFLSNGLMLEGDNLPNLPGIFTDIIVDLSKKDDFSNIPEDERTWELRIPSSLTALQASNIGIEGKGLPCECKPEGEGWGLGAPFTMVGLGNNDNTGGA